MEAPAAGETPAVEVPAVETPAVESPAIPLIEAPAVEGGAVVPPAKGSFKVSKSKFQFVSTAAPQDAPVVQAVESAVQTAVEQAVQTQVPATPTAPVVDANLGAAPVVGSTPVQTGAGEATVATTPEAPAATPTTPVTTPAAEPAKTQAQTTPAASTPATPAAPAAPAVEQEDESPLGGLGDIMEATSGSDEDSAEDNRKPKPLVDVADAVKRSMCEVAARKSMEQSLTKASVIIQDHFHKMLRWEEYDNKKGDPPAIDVKGQVRSGFR